MLDIQYLFQNDHRDQLVVTICWNALQRLLRLLQKKLIFVNDRNFILKIKGYNSNIKILMCGEGSDELYGGYQIYLNSEKYYPYRQLS